MGKILQFGANNVKEKTDVAPPERVANFIRRVIRGEKFYPGAERRANLRYPITMPVKATPLDNEQQPVDEPFLAVTRDISVGGLCMYHLEPVKARYLQLELSTHSDPEKRLQVVLEVVRCRQTGPLHEIAGRFVAGYA